MKISVQRSIADPVLLKFGDVYKFEFSCALSEQEAIEFCDPLRRVIEAPTQKEPQGGNVIAMSAGAQ